MRAPYNRDSDIEWSWTSMLVNAILRETIKEMIV